jgi:phosphoribosylamine--glycine ligase
MNILVIGSGGREHALIWKLSQSKNVKNIYAIPGNGGIADIAECIEMDQGNIDELIKFAKNKSIDLVVIGPENALAQGIVDAFEERGIPIFGPKKKGSLIEASKIFSKELMDQHKIPTAPFRVFTEFKSARSYLDTVAPPYVIKADGLCAGKGAYVIKEIREAQSVLEDLMVNAIYGDAGRKIIIEDFLPGIEASYLAFTDGNCILPMLAAQDHKPLLDNDKGPNTGGMGAYTPIPFISESMEKEIKNSIMLKTIEAMKESGIHYKGVLYGGLMLSQGQPYVIEFNARFGDPETQPILFMMKSDIVPILTACIDGTLDTINTIDWKDGVSVCVVMTSRGYPEKPEKGKIIKGLDALRDDKNIMVFHSGTKKIDGQYYTSGGRVLGITAVGNTYEDAVNNAYNAVSKIEFDGMYFRKDIGKKALIANIM